MRFSIIVVCLNPGQKLKSTMDSILGQTYRDFEVILKDGGSTDGSVEPWRQGTEMDGPVEPDGRSSESNGAKVRFFQEKDKGIYDAMNQAVSHAAGDFVLFMNCGDSFPDDKVLERTAEHIAEQETVGADMDRLVLYGDIFGEKHGVTVVSSSKITGFTCYRNIPCHQSCFYSTALCREKPYDLQYRIRADYDHFLWCFYRAGAQFEYMGFPVASYEGGGYSESRENRSRNKQEHKQITKNYMGKGELLCYRAIMACTLAPLRRVMAESKIFSGAYHWLKERLYRRKFWIMAAFLLFAAEMALLLWPGYWMGEEKQNYLTVEGSWTLETDEENSAYCQEFIPEYRHMKSIGVVATTGGVPLASGEMSVIVRDSHDHILFRTEIPYEQLIMDRYKDVTMDITVQPGKSYYLEVSFVPDEVGIVPALKVCGPEYYVPENQTLIREGNIADTQLVTMYTYEHVLTKDKILKTVFLCAVTAFGIAVGLPKNKTFRRLAGLLLLAAGPYVLGQRLELLTFDSNYLEYLLPFAMKWNMRLMYLLEFILLLCTQSMAGSIFVSNLLLTLIYSANYYVYTFRGDSLRLSDLTAIGTAANVVGQYDLRPNNHLAMAWCLLLVFLVYGIQVGVREKWFRKRWKRWVFRGISLAVGVGTAMCSGYLLLHTDFFVKRGFQDLRGFDQDQNYHFNGYLVASCIDIQASRITKPEGYSVETVEAIFDAVNENSGKTSEAGGVLPHVILVMNESFSDLRVLGNLQISQENLSFFYSLDENVVRGFVNSSVIGGGTANSEFEVFTGSTMGFLPISYYAYQQCMNKPIPSLISNMEELGYTTYSMHPENSSNWSRNSVYKLLGFDHSLWVDDFSGANGIHFGVSDVETFKKVEELYENRGENERMFIFDLTIQNHGGYSRDDVEKTVTALNVSNVEADRYLSLIQESDRAFQQLVSYFENQKEPVVICMFGDHQPMISEGDFYEDVFSQTEGLTEWEKELNLYKVPFIIWANYDIPEQDDLDIGMGYLGALLLDVAGIPSSPYFSYLQQYMKEFPVITVNGYLDSEGNYYSWSGEESEMLEYRMLQYNHLFDNNIVSWGFEVEMK